MTYPLGCIADKSVSILYTPFCHGEYESVNYTLVPMVSDIFLCAANSLLLSVVMERIQSLKGVSILMTVVTVGRWTPIASAIDFLEHFFCSNTEIVYLCSETNCCVLHNAKLRRNGHLVGWHVLPTFLC